MYVISKFVWFGFIRKSTNIFGFRLTIILWTWNSLTLTWFKSILQRADCWPLCYHHDIEIEFPSMTSPNLTERHWPTRVGHVTMSQSTDWSDISRGSLNQKHLHILICWPFILYYVGINIHAIDFKTDMDISRWLLLVFLVRKIQIYIKTFPLKTFHNDSNSHSFHFAMT